jgi:hypothetical protein
MIFKISNVLMWTLILSWGIMVFYPCTSHADMEAEVEHLLHYINTSDCSFIRNGKSHDSIDAGAHIRKKYAHIKSRIKTTEDFIQYAATKSSISGRPYEIICDGEKMATAEWLAQELDRFRGISK